MSTYNVQLKRVVDDSYEIEIGFGLQDKLISEIKNGLVGNIKKFVVVVIFFVVLYGVMTE